MLARGARRGDLVVISPFPCLEQHGAEDDRDDDEPLAHELWQRHALGEFLERSGLERVPLPITLRGRVHPMEPPPIYSSLMRRRINSASGAPVSWTKCPAPSTVSKVAGLSQEDSASKAAA